MRPPVLFLSLILALARCGGSPQTHFYTLDPVPAGQPSSSRHLDPPIVVGRVELPGELDRPSLVTRGAGNTINVSDRDRWAAPLDELVRRALTGDLRTRLSPDSVLAPGDATSGNVRTLTFNVRRFMADQSGSVVLNADWTIERHKAPAATRHAAVEVSATGTGGDAIAAAMSQALGKLADQVAPAL